MKTSFSALALASALLLSSANAHVQLQSPLPFRSSTGAPQNAAQKDFDMKAPLAPSGSNFPCKGYHKDKQGTQSLVDWAAGSTQTMKFDGSATHGGGSCQASLSEDGGTTWKVMKSFIGGCPLKDASFTVPKEAKSGAAIFSWTWFNKEGNREMYMNCAAVTITGGGSGLSAYPNMFTANIGNNCATQDGVLAFPNPGQNVEGSGGVPPTGAGCGAAGSQPPAGGSPPSAPGSGSPTTSVPSSSSVPGGPDGNKPNPSPTSSSVTPTAPPPTTTSPPAPPGTTKTSTQPPSPTTSSPAPPGTTKKPAQPPSPTTNSPAATGTGTPAPSYPAPAPPTAPSPSSQPSTGGACVEGAITCNADGTWSQCGSGVNQNMGKPAAGTVCANGRMQAIKTKRSIRFSSEHMARNA